MFEGTRQTIELRFMLWRKHRTQGSFLEKSGAFPDEEEPGLQEIEESVLWLRTQILVRQADKYLVHVPGRIGVGNGVQYPWKVLKTKLGSFALSQDALAGC